MFQRLRNRWGARPAAGDLFPMAPIAKFVTMRVFRHCSKRPVFRTISSCAGSSIGGGSPCRRCCAWRFGYRWGPPVLSAQIAAGLPESVLVSVSDQALASLDERVLQPSRLPASRQAISARFSGLRSPVERPLAHRVVFRAAKGFPANAIALPSGTLVALTIFVTLARNDSELAVLAHELDMSRRATACANSFTEHGCRSADGMVCRRCQQ